YLPFLWFSTWPGLYPVIAMLSGFTISLVILWSLVPRKDAFSAPGPALTADAHPRLFNELSSIADRFNEPIPAEVYLAPEVNAWVAERGGVMGFGSRRVMVLGLPLLSTLSISQFRAV